MNKKLLIVDAIPLMIKAATLKSVYNFDFKTTLEADISSLIKETNSTHILFAWDSVSHESLLKTKKYPDYKSNRKTDKSLNQLRFQYNFIKSLGFKNIYSIELEADDLIASVVKKYEDSFNKITIYTTDTDLFQLISTKTSVLFEYNASNSKFVDNYKKSLYDLEKFNTRYGLSVKQFNSYKSLVGDYRNNYSGIVGIGHKTAISILSNGMTIDQVYKNINNLDVKRVVKKKLLDNRASCNKAFLLSTLNSSVDVIMDINKLVV